MKMFATLLQRIWGLPLQRSLIAVSRQNHAGTEFSEPLTATVGRQESWAFTPCRNTWTLTIHRLPWLPKSCAAKPYPDRSPAHRIPLSERFMESPCFRLSKSMLSSQFMGWVLKKCLWYYYCSEWNTYIVALQIPTLVLVELFVFIVQELGWRGLSIYRWQAFGRRSFYFLVRSNSGMFAKLIRGSRPTRPSSFSNTSPHVKATARGLDKGLEPQV